MAIAAEDKRLAQVLLKHLVAHSGRRMNFLFWNVIHRKDRILCFVNQIGKELNVINDPNTCVRFTKVKDISEWELICDALDKIIPNSNPHIVRVDMLVSYLNKLSYNLDDMLLETSSENSIHYVTMIKDTTTEEGEKKRFNHIAFPLNDLHNEYFIKKFKDFYSLVLLKPKEEVGEVDDITERWKDSDKEFPYEVTNGKKIIRIPILEGLDLPPSKFIAIEDKDCRTPAVVQIVKLPGDVTRFAYVYRSDKLDIISARVYLNFFLAIQ